VNRPYQFDLNGNPPTPHRAPQIEVSFEIDANEIPKVGVVENGKSKSIQPPTGRAHCSPTPPAPE
ncbi:hypothetical protein FRC00_001751, partial [Tulasnella sp. 408]